MKRKKLLLSLFAASTVGLTSIAIFAKYNFIAAKGDGQNSVTNVLNKSNAPTTSSSWVDNVTKTISNYATYKYERVKTFGDGHCTMAAGSYITKTNVANSITSIKVNFRAVNNDSHHFTLMVQTKDKEEDNWGYAYGLTSGETLTSQDGGSLGNLVRFYTPIDCEVISLEISFGCVTPSSDLTKYWYIGRNSSVTDHTYGAYSWKTKKVPSNVNVPTFSTTTTYTLNATDCNRNIGNWDSATTSSDSVTLGKGKGNVIVFPFYCDSNMKAKISATFATGTAGNEEGYFDSNNKDGNTWSHFTLSLDAKPIEFAGQINRSMNTFSPRSNKDFYLEKGYHNFVIQDYSDDPIQLVVQKIAFTVNGINLARVMNMDPLVPGGQAYTPKESLNGYGNIITNATYLADLDYLSGAYKSRTNACSEKFSNDSYRSLAGMGVGSEVVMPFKLNEACNKLRVIFSILANPKATTNWMMDHINVFMGEYATDGSATTIDFTNCSETFLQKAVGANNWKADGSGSNVDWETSSYYAPTGGLQAGKTYAIKIVYLSNENRIEDGYFVNMDCVRFYPSNDAEE